MYVEVVDTITCQSKKNATILLTEGLKWWGYRERIEQAKREAADYISNEGFALGPLPPQESPQVELAEVAVESPDPEYDAYLQVY